MIKIYKEVKIVSTLIVIGISIIMFLNSFVKSNNENIYLYNIYQDTNYKVYVNQNEILDKEFIEMDKAYIKQSIRNIQINFEYEFNASAKKNIGYMYNIIAVLYIDYSNTSQNVYEKKYEIVKDKFLNKNDDNKLSVLETINIDYNQYIEEVNNFTKTYNLPVNAYLKVFFEIDTSVELQETVNRISSSEVNIDLTSPVFEIRVNQSENQNDTILETGELIGKANKTQLVISIILCILSVWYFLIETFKYEKSKDGNKLKEANKIIKKYSKMLIEIDEPINTKNKTVIKVQDFYALQVIEEEIRIPILVYKKDDVISMYIVDGKTIYLWEVK